MASSTTTNNFYTEQMNFILMNQGAPLTGATTFYVGLLLQGTTYASALAQTYSEVPPGVGYARAPIARSAGSTGTVGCHWPIQIAHDWYQPGHDVLCRPNHHQGRECG